MAAYVLSGCSSADLSKEHFEAIDVRYICMHFTLDGVSYPDDLGQSMPADEMYARMAKGASTSTSQINISEYVDYFSAFCEQGLDIVHVSLSSGISGTYGSAVSAALIVRERYPEREIYVIDSLGASSGYGLILDTAAAMRDKGLSAKELADWIEANRLKLHHWFFSTDLSSYVRGGRISKTAAFFGGARAGRSAPRRTSSARSCRGWSKTRRTAPTTAASATSPCPPAAPTPRRSRASSRRSSRSLTGKCSSTTSAA